MIATVVQLLDMFIIKSVSSKIISIYLFIFCLLVSALKRPKDAPLDPSLPTASASFAHAGKYYREALRIDPTNWHAGNGIAILLAQQNMMVIY